MEVEIIKKKKKNELTNAESDKLIPLWNKEKRYAIFLFATIITLKRELVKMQY